MELHTSSRSWHGEHNIRQFGVLQLQLLLSIWLLKIEILCLSKSLFFSQKKAIEYNSSAAWKFFLSCWHRTNSWTQLYRPKQNITFWFQADRLSCSPKHHLPMVFCSGRHGFAGTASALWTVPLPSALAYWHGLTGWGRRDRPMRAMHPLPDLLCCCCCLLPCNCTAPRTHACDFWVWSALLLLWLGKWNSHRRVMTSLVREDWPSHWN